MQPGQRCVGFGIDRDRGPRQQAAFGQNQRADQDQVQQDRRRRRRRKAPRGVQQPRHKGGQRNEQDVAKGHAPQIDGQFKAHVARKAARHRQHEPRHGQLGHQRQGDEQAGQTGKGIARKAQRVFAGLELFREHRHEGRVERAFGEKAAKHVGQRKGDEERFGHGTGAHIGRDQDVAHKPKNAAGKRPEAHGDKARDQADGAGHRCHLRRPPVRPRARSRRAACAPALLGGIWRAASGRTCP